MILADIIGGNRCGHDPHNPRLSPPEPIKKGLGGLPAILALAAERAKEWFFNPGKCGPLQGEDGRQMRSERREAIQVVLEFMLSRLDLATLCVGTPTMNSGFIDVDMKTVVTGTGLNQRRCERAIRNLKEAGFMEIHQPRHINEEGKYVGLRAIRVVSRKLFEWLGLGSMLERERKKASRRLARKAAQFGRTLGDVVRRKMKSFRMPFGRSERPQLDLETRRSWNRALSELLKAGVEIKEAQRTVNRKFGFPLDWSPGQGAPQKV